MLSSGIKIIAFCATGYLQALLKSIPVNVLVIKNIKNLFYRKQILLLQSNKILKWKQFIHIGVGG